MTKIEIPENILFGFAKRRKIVQFNELIDYLVKKGLTKREAIDQFKRGVAVEMEHTNTPEVASIIAADHLVEYPNPPYYTALAKMEKELEKYNKAKGDRLVRTPGGTVGRVIETQGKPGHYRHLLETDTGKRVWVRGKLYEVKQKANRAAVEPLYFQPIPHGVMFNYENVKTMIENEGLSIKDAKWEPETDKKIHEIRIITEPKNVNKMKKVEGKIDDNIQASGVEQSGRRSIIVQATDSGDLLFIVEGGISRVYQEENEEIGI